jgi:hypothetical protein
MADEWYPEEPEDEWEPTSPWRYPESERVRLPSHQTVKPHAGSSIIPRSSALVPYKDPTKLNVKLPTTGPLGEHRRRIARSWGGIPQGGAGIGHYLRLAGAKSHIGRIGQGIVKLWEHLSPHHKKALMEFMGQPVSERSPLDAIQDTDIYRKIMELVTPESEKPVEGGKLLTHYPKYQPRLEKFIQNIPQDSWSDPTQLRGLFENAMKKGLISRDEFYYEGGSGKNTWGSLPIEQRSLGNFLDNLSKLSKGEHTSLVTSPAKQERFLKQITKQDLLDVVRQNPLGITELELSKAQAEAENDHSLSLLYPPGGRNPWTLPGGHDYSELMLNLSDIKDDKTRNRVSDLLHTSGRAPLINNMGWARLHKRPIYTTSTTARNEVPEYYWRQDVERRKLSTHTDEFQTDIRFEKGFPLKDKVMEILMQRVFRQAAEDGTDYISWTPGEEQAERSKQKHYINNVRARRLEPDTPGIEGGYGDPEEPTIPPTDWPMYRVQGHYNEEMEFPPVDYKDSELDRAFGKEFANKIRTEATLQSDIIKAPHDESDPLTADGLRTDKSLGMATVYTPGGLKKMELYNKKLVNIANKLAKKFNTKVEWNHSVLVPGTNHHFKVPSIKVTPELRKFYSTAPIKLAQGGLVDKPLYEDSGMRYG